ncbi:MAG: hypothetical protein J7K68_04355 [Candidatus Diapherotrites archaeon]|nr:hypothetical protein [Candidatus Diapherotrites archaeon]
MPFDRAVAFKVSIDTIHKGTFHKSDEEFKPSYIDVDGKKISRVNIVGTVVKKQGAEAVIDDGTGDVSLIAFRNELDRIEEGDVVRVIGKIRERDGERNIYVEALKKVDKAYLKLRKLEIERNTQKEEDKDILLEIEEMDVGT